MCSVTSYIPTLTKPGFIDNISAISTVILDVIIYDFSQNSSFDSSLYYAALLE